MFESIFSQNNSPEQPHGDKRASKESPEKEPSSDVPLDVLRAEEIAEARGEITNKLFIENSPAEKWQELSDSILAKHPRLRDYEGFFRNVIEEALKKHDALEKLWEGAGASAPGSASRSGNANLTEADPQSSKRLFQMVFGLEPEGRVEATKGKFSLTFILGEKDISKARENSTPEGQSIEVTPLGFALPHDEVPIIAINRNQRDPQAEYVVTSHEAEHIRNGILREGRYRTLGEIELEGKEGTLQKTLERELGGLPMEESAKDEILAQFTYLQLLEGSRSVNPELDRRFDEAVSETASKIRTIADPDTYYSRKFQELYSPTEEEEERYQRSVARGVDAYLRLWRLFEKNGSKRPEEPVNNAFFKVSNILEQFPLYKWPGVVRLFEMRRRTKGVQ